MDPDPNWTKIMDPDPNWTKIMDPDPNLLYRYVAPLNKTADYVSSAGNKQTTKLIVTMSFSAFNKEPTRMRFLVLTNN